MNINKLKIHGKERGSAFIIAIMLFMLVTMTIVFGIASPIVRQLSSANEYIKSKQSYYAAEAVSEDAFYRYKNNIAIVFPEVITIDGATATATQAVTGSNQSTITGEGNNNGVIRKIAKDIGTTNGFSFTYAMQSGLGGVSFDNNSYAIGNIYSNGSVTGGGNYIYGAVVSAGPSGLISGIHATSSAYAHTIQSSTINADAYYQSISGTTVSGSSCPNAHCHSGSTDQATTTMPISDSLISQWETSAATGGSVTCSGGTYTINSDVTIGPKKIPCNLSISGSPTVTLTGDVWVTGTIGISNSAILKVADSIGNKSLAVIADKAGSNSSSATITLINSTSFFGSTGNADSYVMLVSMNSSAESGGNTVAVGITNGAVGNLLIYAPHGLIQLKNNVTLREVTGYQLSLVNNAVVSYSIGLAQPLFVSGPSGTWQIKRWREQK
ncbi:MAG: hypothetical protein V4438_00295 [Patescibacteria group bacterium]